MMFQDVFVQCVMEFFVNQVEINCVFQECLSNIVYQCEVCDFLVVGFNLIFLVYNNGVIILSGVVVVGVIL